VAQRIAGHADGRMEDHFHDLKAREIKPSKWSESIFAFCNSAGGEIYVRIRENESGAMKQRVWDGFSEVEESDPILQMLDQIAPLAGFYTATLLECPAERGPQLVNIGRSRRCGW
jgi:ATP-dependent DNA helicase RecG